MVLHPQACCMLNAWYRTSYGASVYPYTMRVHTEYSTSSSDSDNDHLAAPRQGSKVSLLRTVGHISDFPVKKKTTQAFCCRIQTRDGWTRKKKRRRHHNWYDTRHSACSRLVGVKPSINFNLKTIDARNL